MAERILVTVPGVKTNNHDLTSPLDQKWFGAVLNIRDQVAYDAKVVWRRNGEAGIKWGEVIPLAGSLNAR